MRIDGETMGGGLWEPEPPRAAPFLRGGELTDDGRGRVAAGTPPGPPFLRGGSGILTREPCATSG
jgi:hypothetical protein